MLSMCDVFRKELMDKGFFDSRANIPYYSKLGVCFFILASLALYCVLRCKSFEAHMLGAVFLVRFVFPELLKRNLQSRYVIKC